MTDRNPNQQEKAALLFESASRLKLSITLHLNVITEFVYVMDKIYDIDRNKISEIISDLLIMPGVNLVCEIDMTSVLAIWPSSISDYGDALLAARNTHIPHSGLFRNRSPVPLFSIVL